MTPHILIMFDSTGVLAGVGTGVMAGVGTGVFGRDVAIDIINRASI